MVKRIQRPTHMNKIVNEDIDRSRMVIGVEPERRVPEDDVRGYDEFYDLPDYDNFDYSNVQSSRQLALTAPPPRIHERYGKMRQYWAAWKLNNNRRVQELMADGWRIRHPETVPISFKSYTEKWEMHDVIMVAGELILMECPESHVIKIERLKHQNNNNIIRDIRQQHGMINFIGQSGMVEQIRDQTAGKFHTTQDVRQDSSGDRIDFTEE